MKCIRKNAARLFACLMLLSLTSCYTTKVYHGNINKTEPMVKINQEWNHHIIGGLVPIGAKMKAEEYVGKHEKYMVKTHQSFLNLLVNAVTFGLYTPTTTTYYVPLNSLTK